MKWGIRSLNLNLLCSESKIYEENMRNPEFIYAITQSGIVFFSNKQVRI